VIPIRDNVPTRTFPIVTVGLIVANVLVYIWENTGRGLTQHVFAWGFYPCQVQGPCTNAGLVGYTTPHHPLVETVFTSMFMHAGIIHIAGNMLFLWIFGNNVEDLLGRVRFLLWYLAAGIAADAMQTFVTLQWGNAQDASIPNVGASGAIAAVLGAYFILVRRARVLTLITLGFFFIFRELPAALFLGVWILFQAIEGGLSLTTPQAGGGVAFFAHIGGFAFGLLTAALVRKRRPLEPPL
jgi:membrane associated rhomboid family serine protease